MYKFLSVDSFSNIVVYAIILIMLNLYKVNLIKVTK